MIKFGEHETVRGKFHEANENSLIKIIAKNVGKITHKTNKAQTCNFIVDMNCSSPMHLIWVHHIF